MGCGTVGMAGNGGVVEVHEWERYGGCQNKLKQTK